MAFGGLARRDTPFFCGPRSLLTMATAAVLILRMIMPVVVPRAMLFVRCRGAVVAMLPTFPLVVAMRVVKVLTSLRMCRRRRLAEVPHPLRWRRTLATAGRIALLCLVQVVQV